ncbi:MAG: autotransporter-associated beta strand repeat-containing protein [Dokdonella sp.]
MIVRRPRQCRHGVTRRVLWAALACATPALHAATFTWLGLGNSNNWVDNSGNWSSSSPDPYPGYLSLHDGVVLPAVSQGYQITLFGNFAIDGVSVGAPYVLTVTGGLILQQAVSGDGLAINLLGGNVLFKVSSSAGSTTISGDHDSELAFLDNATAATADIESAGLVTFQGNATASNASLSLIGGSLDVSGMASPLTLGALHDTLASPGSLILGSTSLTLQSAADQIFHGSVAGSGVLTQAGAGRLTLSGNNETFAGSLIVQAGALQLDGDFSVAPVSVQGGASLRGGGRVGTVSLFDGTLAPGGGAGVSLRVASLACTDAQIVFDLDASARLVIDQALAVSQCPQWHITLTASQPIASAQSFNVATLSSGTDYTLADISITPPAGHTARASREGNDIVVTLYDPADEIFGDSFD